MAKQSKDGPILKLFCLIEGDNVPFSVEIAANTGKQLQVVDLKKIICHERPRVLDVEVAHDLRLLKVTTIQSPA